MSSAQPTDIEATLTGGDPRRLDNQAVIDLVLTDPDRLDDLLACVFSDDEIVRMRASDALEKVGRRRPDLVQPHVSTLLEDMPKVRQPSVQWHLAQLLTHVELDFEERTAAVEVLVGNLASMDDWIVVNLTLEALAHFARIDPTLTGTLLDQLRRHEGSRHKSVASRVAKLLAEFG